MVQLTEPISDKPKPTNVASLSIIFVKFTHIRLFNIGVENILFWIIALNSFTQSIMIIAIIFADLNLIRAQIIIFNALLLLHYLRALLLHLYQVELTFLVEVLVLVHHRRALAWSYNR
jgi:hypothetical protein